jgi:3-phenylpropionate/trans-cinnamate dioxygenase ferredoxin reductase subunit
MSESAGIVVVGAGQGGASAIAALRQCGYAGPLTLVGDEPERPYERPPLSKEYLAGEKTFERLVLRPESFWSENQVTLRLGERVHAVDPVARMRATDAGTIGYESLIWAAGGSPRRLTCPGHDLGGVHVVRTRADIDRLRAELGDVRQVAVIGGGYIGLEAAAVLRKLGKPVALIESLERVLARVAGPALSRFYEAEHRAHGVVLHLGATVEALEGRDGRVSAVRLAGGAVVEADLVIVGIGIVPSVEPLLAAGARGGNGVEIDESGRTSLEGVSALGDCAMHRNRHAGGAWIRLESVQNANDQALVVARTLTGTVTRYDALPWFWSNQYDLRLQTIGLSLGHDQVLLRGDPATRAFSVVYLKEGVVRALDCVNQPRDFAHGRLLISRGIAVDPVRLADASIPLKTLVG